MANTLIRIKDTGARTVGGSVDYTQVGSGAWIDLSGFSLTGDFTVTGTNNVSFQENTSDTTLLTFQANEVSALQAPRLTLRGIVPATSTALITNIINLSRSKGIKRLTGGLGMIDAIPEVATDTYQYVSVIIKNITFTETVSGDDTNINFTIQLEQTK